MDSKRKKKEWVELLAEPPAGCHVVQTYAGKRPLARAVGLFGASGLSRGEALVVVATEANGHLFMEALREQGVDVTAARRQGRLITRDAAVDLEGLWNRLLSSRWFSLFCAYEREALKSDGGRDIARMAKTHSHLLADDTFAKIDMTVARSLQSTLGGPMSDLLWTLAEAHDVDCDAPARMRQVLWPRGTGGSG